jgi:hypothetical protein
MLTFDERYLLIFGSILKNIANVGFIAETGSDDVALFGKLKVESRI